jgi:hypothetical protein
MRRLAFALAASIACAVALAGSPPPADSAGSLTLPFPTTNYAVTQGYWTNSGFAYHLGHPAYDLVPLDTTSIAAAALASATLNWDANCGPDPSQAQPDCDDDACGPGESYGRWVDVDHGGGMHAIYAHLRTFSVPAGPVVRGEELGVMGSAGCSTGPHLHFQVLQAEVSVDPGDPKTCDLLTALWTSCPATYEGPIEECPFGAGPCVSVSGDVNCDETVNAIDALLMLRGAAGLANSGLCFAGSGDVNCSGAINAVDALFVLRHVAGLPVVLPQDCPPIGGAPGFP